MELPFLGITITLIFSSFFSGMEIAYISSNRLKVELDKTKKTLHGKTLSVFYKNESHFIAMLLLGNNVSLVFFGLCSAKILGGILFSWGVTGELVTLIIQTSASTAVVLLIAEFLPKTFVQINPNRFLRFSLIPMIIIYGILYIPTYIILWLSNFFLKILKVDNKNKEKMFSKVDLENYVQDINERILDKQDLGNEVQILQNALDFDSTKARDCMVPRTELVVVSVADNIKDLNKKFIRSGKSKILVYKENIDQIIGYVHSFEMFKSPKSIKEILLPIPFVPEATPAKEILELFTQKSGNIAVIVDEYGGTAGVVTIEDVIEEIFGEIEDEHDNEDFIEEKLSETEYRFSARLGIEHLNEIYNLNISISKEYGTLGGLIIHSLASIPIAGTMVKIGGIKYYIEEVSHNRIEVVRVEK